MSVVSAANLRLLPTSPLKQILPPHPENTLPQVAINNMILKARADSTDDGNENNRAGDISGTTPPAAKKTKKPRKSGPSKGGKKKQKQDASNLIPFVKHHHSVKKMQTPSVSRRNARERNRVKQVNNGFGVLKNHIPAVKNKTSKVDTLRAAVDYIKALRVLLGEDNDDLDYDGPVLITDAMAEDMAQDDSCLADESSTLSSSPQRSLSVQSGEVNPMVYSLPPMSAAEFTAVISSSSSSPQLGGVSPKSEEVDSSSMQQQQQSSYNDNFWWSQHEEQQQQQSNVN